jgi:hypothetical protein
MIPCLLHLLNDDTAAVSRQAIYTGTTVLTKYLNTWLSRSLHFQLHLLRVSFSEVQLTLLYSGYKIQGVFSSEGIDDPVKSSWDAHK